MSIKGITEKKGEQVILIIPTKFIDRRWIIQKKIHNGSDAIEYCHVCS